VLDYGVKENYGGEEARVDEREVTEDVGTVGVPDAYYWHWHLGAEDVSHVQEVADVVGPCGWGGLVLGYVEVGERLTVVA
jgi:hypothetical protein